MSVKQVFSIGPYLPLTNSTNVQIEILQLTEFQKHKLFSAKLRSTEQSVETGEQDYIHDISHKKCESIHKTGVYKYDNMHIISTERLHEASISQAAQWTNRQSVCGSLWFLE